jgi:hypothetical protein
MHRANTLVRCPGRSIGHYPIPPIYLYRDTVQVVHVVPVGTGSTGGTVWMNIRESTYKKKEIIC